jgi:hypothetical protein
LPIGAPDPSGAIAFVSRSTVQHVAAGKGREVVLHVDAPRRDDQRAALDLQAIGMLQRRVAEPDAQRVILEHVDRIRQHVGHEHATRAVHGGVVEKDRALGGPAAGHRAALDVDRHQPVDVAHPECAAIAREPLRCVEAGDPVPVQHLAFGRDAAEEARAVLLEWLAGDVGDIEHAALGVVQHALGHAEAVERPDLLRSLRLALPPVNVRPWPAP